MPFKPLTLQTALLLAVLAALAALLLAFHSNATRATRFVEEPHGCDWFGYMRQSRLFRDNGWINGLDTAIRDERTLYVIGVAKLLSPDSDRWAEAVAPHCHHYKARTDRVLLQYPPGTGFLLSFFPEGQQARWLFLLSGFFIFVALTVVIAGARAVLVPCIAAAGGLLCLSGMYNFVHDRSVYATAAMMFVLGWIAVAYGSDSTLRRRVTLAAVLGLLIGLSVSLRIPNILLAAGPGAVIGLAALHRPWGKAALPAIAFGLALVVGLLPVLAANAINAGHPLATTYSTADATASSLSLGTILEGLRFYLVERSTTGLYVAIAVLLLAGLLAAALRSDHRGVAAAGVMGIVNLTVGLAYMASHQMRNAYYLFPFIVFATATGMFGLIALANDRARSRLAAPLAPAIRIALVAVSVGIAGWVMKSVSIPVSANFAAPDVKFTFEPKAVVWADTSTGAIVFYLNRQAGKLNSIEDSLLEPFVDALSRDGVPQYFIVDTDVMSILVRRLARNRVVTPVGQAFGKDTFLIAPRAP